LHILIYIYGREWKRKKETLLLRGGSVKGYYPKRGYF